MTLRIALPALIGLLTFAGCDDKEPVDTAPSTDTSAATDTAPSSDDTSTSDTNASDTNASDTNAPDAAPTWYADVQPILNQHCFGCHSQDTNVTGLPLDDYMLAAAMAEPIAESTTDRSMPLWPPEDGCGDLIHDNELSDESIQTLADWAAAGAPEGDPATIPEEIEQPQVDWDVELVMGEHTSPAGVEDEYRCFVLDPETDVDTFITGFEVDPGNDATVHHVILYTDPDRASQVLDDRDPGEGYTCFGSPGLTNTAVIGGWVPGPSDQLWMPEGKGLRLSAGSLLVMEIHYHPDGEKPQPDQTALKLKLEDDADELYTYFLGDWSLNIPANDPEHLETATTSLNYGGYQFELDLYGIIPHMHLLGTEIRFTVVREDGSEECAIAIPEWDFEFQQLYWYTEPMKISSADKVRIECVYDNSADNPNQPNDPPENVRFGEGTDDEMCLGYIMFDVSF